MTSFRFPTFDEMRAMELAAKRARNRELARLARAVTAYIAKRLGSLFGATPVRAFSARRSRTAHPTQVTKRCAAGSAGPSL
jgi:hypothetical protein